MPGKKLTFDPPPMRPPSAVIHICQHCGRMVEQTDEGRAVHQIRDRRSRFDGAKVCADCYRELTGAEP